MSSLRDPNKGVLMVDNTISGVGFSNKWDSTVAGHEVAVDLLNKMNGKKPNLILLFSSIHYLNNGGFDNLLKEFYKIFPSDVPLIGGTVAGFIIPQGCFSHGVTAFGIYSEEMDFIVAVAENIKRNPEKAASICSNKLKESFSKSKFKNNFILSLPSGTTSPKIPGIPDNTRVIKSKFLSKLMIIGLQLSLVLLQKGPGREEIIIETLAKNFPDSKIIGGSFIDDNKGYYNFQFLNKKVYTNMLITVGVSTDLNISVNSNFGLVETQKKFKITKKSVFDLFIEEINGKPASSEILSILGWPAYFLEDSAKILRRTFYVPIGYLVNGKRYISMMAFIFGTGVVVSPKVMSEDACIMTASGKQILDVVDQNLIDTKQKELCFGWITSCIVRLENLGASGYEVHSKLKEHFKDKAFIQIDVVGEDVYTKEIGAKRIANSFNTAVFYSGDKK